MQSFMTGGMLATPDEFALAIVMQYLSERGFSAALAALEGEAGLLYVEDKVQRGSQLMELVYKKMEDDLAASLDDGAALCQQREERLMRPGLLDYPCTLLHTISLLQANVLCVQCLPSLRLAVAGAADGMLQVLSYEGQLVHQVQASSSGVLCLAFAPGPDGCPTPLVATGCMDGSVVVADVQAGSVLHTSKQAHRKYVVAMQWAGDGQHLVSGAWDQTLVVHRWQDQQQLLRLHSEPCTGQVTAVQFLPGGRSFLVAVRGSCFLKQFSINAVQCSSDSVESAKASSSSFDLANNGAPVIAEQRRLNMNVTGDTHVSFSTMHLTLSPCSEYLLASADNGRLIMWHLEDWQQVRNFYGLPTEQFHQFAATFDASSCYILAAAAHGGVVVYEVASAKAVCTFRAHEKNVRGLCLDMQNNILLTCSFDRTVKLWAPAEQAAQGAT